MAKNDSKFEEYRLNITTLKLLDPCITEYTAYVKKVTLYIFCGNTGHWEETDIEGEFFVCSRSREPSNSIIILNHDKKTNLMEPILEDWDWKKEDPLLLFKKGPNIHGIRFYVTAEYEEITNLVEGLVQSLKHRPQTGAKPKYVMPGSHLPVRAPHPRMESHQCHVTGPHRHSPVPYYMTSPHYLPSPPHNLTIPQPLMPFPQHTMPYPNMPNMPNMPNRLVQLPTMPMPAPPHNMSEQGQGIFNMLNQAQEEFHKVAVAIENQLMHAHNQTMNKAPPMHVNANDTGDGNEDSNDNATSSSGTPSTVKALSPVEGLSKTFEPLCATKKDSTESKDEDEKINKITSMLEAIDTSSKPVLITPEMFEGKFEKKGNQTLGNIENPEPLNEKQMLQAMMYLLKNDPEFVSKLHKAYIKSFFEMFS